MLVLNEEQWISNGLNNFPKHREENHYRTRCLPFFAAGSPMLVQLMCNIFSGNTLFLRRPKLLLVLATICDHHDKSSNLSILSGAGGWALIVVPFVILFVVGIGLTTPVAGSKRFHAHISHILSRTRGGNLFCSFQQLILSIYFRSLARSGSKRQFFSTDRKSWIEILCVNL